MIKISITYACLLITGLLLIAQYTSAEVRPGCGQACKGNTAQEQQQPLDAETKKKYDNFLLETTDLRKEMQAKQVEFETLMTSDNPDSSKIALLTQEYYQLRDFLTEKAQQAGIMSQRQGCNGCNGKSGVACGLPASGKNNIEKTN